MPTPLPRRTALRSAAAVVAVAAAGAVASCSGPDNDGKPLAAGSPAADEDRPRRHQVTPAADSSANALDPRAGGGAAAATLAASRALLAAASIVVVSSGAERDVAAATATARRLGIPLLVNGPDVAAELDRLGTRTVVRWSGDAGRRDPLGRCDTDTPADDLRRARGGGGRRRR